MPPLPFGLLGTEDPGARAQAPDPDNTFVKLHPHLLNSEAAVEGRLNASGARDGGFDGEVDPPYIQHMDNFIGMTLEEIVSMAGPIRSGDIGAVKDAYKSIAAKADISAELAALVATMTEGWEGDAQQAAVASVLNLRQDATALSDGLDQITGKLIAAEVTASAVQTRIPAIPVPPQRLPLLATDAAAAETAKQAATYEARRIMSSIYAPGYTVAGTDVPIMPHPTEVSPASTGTPSGSPAWGQGSGGGAPGGGSGATPNTSGISESRDGAHGEDATTQAASADAPGAASSSGNATGGSAGGFGSATTSAASTAAGTAGAYPAAPGTASHSAGIYGTGGHNGGGGFAGGG
ncbi:hypothetical protein Rrhod_1635 [Rhodococcus rhodnii LMG 5362]|uniref:Uncharacterized protein n=2 Tax=Rhodococcus rhodnii TaxID=38312 RepID=R7WNX2_9NOCA|nr:hypothetical protein Rrhod_1635 [Rhodococcus rhodnii LMG 5362]